MLFCLLNYKFIVHKQINVIDVANATLNIVLILKIMTGFVITEVTKSIQNITSFTTYLILNIIRISLVDGDRDRNDRERDRGGGGSDRDRDRERTRIGDWSEHVSSSGKKYYYNCKTEVSQWEKPKEWLDKER